jgi:hypothetical protein
MRFRHLDYPMDTEVTHLGPAAIDALLGGGDLDTWTPLLRVVASDPFGPLADTILRICDAHPMYGTSPLWRDWIGRRRGRPAPETTTLSDARTRAGLTQAQVAERLGIGQSDVSKLERRPDVRLSTLRAYAAAIGGRLHVAIRGAGDEAPRELALPEKATP